MARQYVAVVDAWGELTALPICPSRCQPLPALQSAAAPTLVPPLPAACCADVVTASSTHSNCITKNYTRTVAAGSVVASDHLVSQLCRVDSRNRTFMPQNPLIRCLGGAAAAALGQPQVGEGGGHSSSSCSSEGGGGAADDGGMVRDESVASADTALLQELRFLTPREVANLHGFPQACHATAQLHAVGSGSNAHGFQLPPSVSARQAYGLLGNSLSVDVFAWLLCYLFATQLESSLCYADHAA